MKRSLSIATMLFTVGLVSANVPTPSASTPAIEVIPIAVWQGKDPKPWNTSLLRNIRLALPDGRLVHAVSAAPLARTEDAQTTMVKNFSEVVQSGDDIILHMAPWRSLVNKSTVEFKYSPTFFGSTISDEDCIKDCGLDLSFSAFSSSEVRAMVATSMGLLTSSGFGAPKAVYFDEGVVASSIRDAAYAAGVVEDWSGIESGQLRESLGRFPLFAWNVQNSARLPLADLRSTQNDGLMLDHVRYAVHAEFGDLDATKALFKAALDTAKAESRTVRVPIVFNVEDLIHTHTFVAEATAAAFNMAKDLGVPVVSWNAMNKSWMFDKIKTAPAAVAVVSFSPVETGEAEFLPDDESEALISVEPTVNAH